MRSAWDPPACPPPPVPLKAHLFTDGGPVLQAVQPWNRLPEQPWRYQCHLYILRFAFIHFEIRRSLIISPLTPPPTPHYLKFGGWKQDIHKSSPVLSHFSPPAKKKKKKQPEQFDGCYKQIKTAHSPLFKLLLLLLEVYRGMSASWGFNTSVCTCTQQIAENINVTSVLHKA